MLAFISDNKDILFAPEFDNFISGLWPIPDLTNPTEAIYLQ
jgi:hypothetical protein